MCWVKAVVKRARPANIAPRRVYRRVRNVPLDHHAILLKLRGSAWQAHHLRWAWGYAVRAHRVLIRWQMPPVARHVPLDHHAALRKSRGNAQRAHHLRWARVCVVRAYRASFRLVQGLPVAHNVALDSSVLRLRKRRAHRVTTLALGLPAVRNVPRGRRAALLKSRGSVQRARHRRWARGCAVLVRRAIFRLVRGLLVACNVLLGFTVPRPHKRVVYPVLTQALG